ncbi:ArsR family transcriptional regulator [Micromonospora sp. WMMD987]|uniref:helix-turn-helix transcriptional regulator n=1 Tax=Micromonospora sp. WMMD987 TaxID=3016089 RepID=UPI00249BFB69|nr:ArsR family transcriptional regulator [Micromonospora sp. WMMD987]WFE93848.1 ArsR family transcriptional regulator [Micromonospora sp. WMMD987]
MKNAAALSGHPPMAGPAVGAGSRSRRAGRSAGPEVGRRAAAQSTSAASTDLSTRDRVTQLLLAQGATTAGQLGSALGLSPAAIRRHLDAMLADGDVLAREQTVRGSRGRGRPAKVFLLTDAARVRCGTHHYDNMATAALRWIARNGGPDAVEAFAADQVAALEARCRAAMEDAGDDPLARSEALAGALTAEGYAANASTIASGGQLCQHHCPVAHVAAEFPQLCEAETAVISRLVGTHVQRLATIAHGDGVCTTHIPTQPRAQSGNTVTTVRTDR